MRVLKLPVIMHHISVQVAVEVSVVMTCTIHHENVEVAGVHYTMTVFKQPSR